MEGKTWESKEMMEVRGQEAMSKYSSIQGCKGLWVVRSTGYEGFDCMKYDCYQFIKVSSVHEAENLTGYG